MIYKDSSMKKIGWKFFIILLTPGVSFCMQQKIQLPSTDELVAQLSKPKLEKYDAQYERELKDLQKKFQAKKERSQKKYVELVRKILGAARTRTSMNDLYTVKPYGSTHYKAIAIPLLHKMAKKSERLELLRLMLDHGANPNLVTFYSPSRPLDLAIAGKAYCNVRLLIERGASTIPHYLSKGAREEIEKDPELKRLFCQADKAPVNNSK